MPTAYSYIRFSSAQQAHGDSLRRQQEMVAGWLTDHPDYELSGLKFEDLGVSGFSQGQEKSAHLKNGFGKLLAAIETGAIRAGDYILIEAIDRAGRLEPNKMLNILTGITGAGVKLVTLDDKVVYDSDPRNSNNLFLLVAKVQQAYNYSDTLSRRVKEAYKGKRERAAEGKGVTRRTPVWLDRDGKLIEDVAVYIVQAFEDYAAGIGERRIHARIHGKHPLLEKLSPGTIKRWFRNPTAIGRWGEIENVYPPVVSKELYFRVQKRLEAKYKPKPAAQKYLLTGLVYCGECGKTMGVQSFTGRSPAVMQCTRRIRLGALGCSNNKSVPYHVLDYIRSQTSHSAVQRAVLSQRLTASEKRRIEIDGELKGLHEQSKNVTDALAAYGMLPAITAKLDALTATITALENERLALPQDVSATLEDVVFTEWDLAVTDFMKLNTLLQGVDYRITCHGHRIVVDEASFGEGESQEFMYKGVNRRHDVYVVEHDGESYSLALPRGADMPMPFLAFQQAPTTPEEEAAIHAKHREVKPKWWQGDD